MSKKNPTPTDRPDSLEDVMYAGRSKTALLKAAIVGLGKMSDDGSGGSTNEAVLAAEDLAREIFQYWDRIDELPGDVLAVVVPEKVQRDE